MKTKLVCLIGAATLATGAVVVLSTTMSASAATVTASSVIWTDNFGDSALDSRWSWIREDPTHWSLTAQPGYMRITAQHGTIDDGTTENILLQTAPPGSFEIETRLVFTPTGNIQRAGLVVYQNDANHLLLMRVYCEFEPQCVGNGIYFDRVEQGQLLGGNFAMTTTVLGEAYLRLIRQGTVYTGYVSENGTNWTLVGTHTVVSGLVPSQIGLMADVIPLGGAEIPADFDFFTLTDNSHRLYLPLILK